ncbi:MAG: ATP-binding cassette domain-containing protein, partial [Bacteroidales bacterium]|nr:ATP-binding cassette domain-containing protein [Bacteroidales bacterium]
VPKRRREEAARRMLCAVGLGDRLHHRPSELSGGQRQRVALARALINSPSIILADEPTGNLDTKTSVDIMSLFEDIHSQGNTIILVTHEEDIARYAHRIIRLRDGKIESDETIDKE